MTLASERVAPPGTTMFPRTISSIVVAGGVLAMFLLFASWILVSYPITSSVSGYFYGVDSPRKVMLPSNPEIQVSNEADLNRSSLSDSVAGIPDSSTSPVVDDDVHVPDGIETKEKVDQLVTPEEVAKTVPDSSGTDSEVNIDVNDKSSLPNETVDQGTSKEETKTVPFSQDSVDSIDKASQVKSVDLETNEKVDQGQTQEEESNTVPISSGSDSQIQSGEVDTGSGDSKSDDNSDGPLFTDGSSASLSNSTNVGVVESDCDLYHGNWFYDPLGPLYTNNTCPVLTQMQNCQGNGRPDKEYENWRWKPFQCDIPRFDPKEFLELMRGKTLAFIGDSVARNQMESMLCLLWQVEAPKNRGNRHMQRWFFRSTSVMIVRIWSSWLVDSFSDPFDFAPAGISKLHLDAPDKGFIDYIPTFDVIVLSSGHWFAKQSVYILNNEIVGGQLWHSDKSRSMKINNVEAYGISVETILTALSTHPNYTGLTIVRTWSPDHYEGGAWNTGGSCTGKVEPIPNGNLVENGFTEVMHKKQVTGFNNAKKKATNKSKLELMDITEAFGYRHDGHPGPYRSPDPNKITKRGPDGKPPPQDCLHWCMPGPVDTWNELVLEIIKRNFKDNQVS